MVTYQCPVVKKVANQCKISNNCVVLVRKAIGTKNTKKWKIDVCFLLHHYPYSKFPLYIRV